MLVISKQQMKQLSADLERHYVRQSAATLRAQYLEFAEKHSPAEAEELVKAGVKQAKLYRITDQKDTLAFLKYIAVFGADFAEQPEHEALRRILLIRNLNGREKIDRLMQKTDPDNP